MRSPHPGKLITIDGPAGVGKTTTARLVREYLADRGYRVHATAEPSHSLLGKAARQHTDTFRGHSLACLVAADRYHHLDTEMRPKLDDGYVVVCDRYVASSLVLQCMDGVPLMFVEALNSDADRPDLAVFLTAPPAVTAARVAARGAHDRFQTAGAGSSDREAGLYRETAARLSTFGWTVQEVDTSYASPTKVAAYLVERIAEVLEGAKPESATA